MSNHELGAQAAPVAASERIGSLDVLRGVAILGILVMNIYAFAMPHAAYSNPLVMGGTDLLNKGTWFFTHILFDQKFMSIFSMLFGAGIVLMTERARAKGARYGRIFYRRQFWLLILGAIHGYLIWVGDILFLYAAVGMFAYWFRNRSPKALVAIAVLLLPVGQLLYSSYGVSLQKLEMAAVEIQELQDAGESINAGQMQILEAHRATYDRLIPSPEALQKDVEIHMGDYASIVKNRAADVFYMQVWGIFFFGLWRVGGLMLLGMALMKTGVLGGERPTGFYRRMMVICYAIGLPLTAFSGIDLNAHEFDAIYAKRAGGIANYVGSIIVALGHVGLVILLIKTGFVQNLLQRFAAVGRTALSNYLMHSLILTTVFYGYGLGLYGEIPRFWQMGFVAAVILLQLYLSPWWLARYRFGPVEWLWRSLTYWQRQPMRRPE